MMLSIVLLAFLLLLPYWLPSLLIRLRMQIFTWVNGRQGLQLPNQQFDAKAFRCIYQHQHANGRSEGAGLSDLFWYWLAPGPEMHQEHLEPGPRYQAIADYTNTVLNKPRVVLEEKLLRCLQQHLLLNSQTRWQLAYGRDLMMPVFAAFYYELVFDTPCSLQAQQLIVAHANDVVTALKCCGLRHMKKRQALTQFIIDKLQHRALAHPFPNGFTLEEQAYYLQGTFFNTAIVQMSDAMVHMLMSLAKQQRWQHKLQQAPHDRISLNHFINETLRLYPLFGIAHRILSADITVDGKVLKKASVVCFNYESYQQQGFSQAKQFQPERWQHCPVKHSHFIPFGFVENRPCPAQAISLVSLRFINKYFLTHYHLYSSARHTRSAANRGPLLICGNNSPLLSPFKRYLLLAYVKLRDQWQEVFRSLGQLVFGSIMVIEAKQLKLCQRYFAKISKT